MSLLHFMILPWFIVWIGLSIIVGVAATYRYNRSAAAWTFLALMFSPLLMGLLLLALGPSAPKVQIVSNQSFRGPLGAFIVLGAILIAVLLVALAEPPHKSNSTWSATDQAMHEKATESLLKSQGYNTPLLGSHN